MKLSDNIKRLRKEKAISQEILANHLGVSFQAVSKWETGAAMPDVLLIPAIASFFGVSTDELFGFNVYEIEQEVQRICDEAYTYRRVGDIAQAEILLREGLKRFPGNEVLLINLLYVLDEETQGEELVMLCKQLANTSHDDEIKYDAIRILAEHYKACDQTELVKPTLEQIPEIYFSKLQLTALLLDGDEAFRAAHLELGIALERLTEMMSVIGEYERASGQTDAAKTTFARAVNVLEIMDINLENEAWKRIYMRWQDALNEI